MRRTPDEPFADRRHAGRELADALADRHLSDPVVLALPRGGVPVAFEIARFLDAPLDVFVARKIGAPGHPEYGIGAISEGGTVVFDNWAVQALHLSGEQLDVLTDAERTEVERRVRQYRGGRPPPRRLGRDVVLVD